MLNFVTALDSNFIIPTSTMLFSLDNNLEVTSRCYILCNKNDFQNVSKVLNAIKFKKLSIRIVEVSKSLINQAIQMNGIMHFTNAAIYRIFMASLLDTNINSIIYLDGDLFIRKRINESLFPNTIFSAHIEKKAAIEAIIVDNYFNSGVFTTQLDFWRENNIEIQLVNFLEKNLQSVYKDQDALNNVFANLNFFPLPEGLNYILKSQNRKDLKKSDPYIVHFAGHMKPWLRYTPNSKYVKEWRTVAKQIHNEFYVDKKNLDFIKRIGYKIYLNKYYKFMKFAILKQNALTKKNKIIGINQVK